MQRFGGLSVRRTQLALRAPQVCAARALSTLGAQRGSVGMGLPEGLSPETVETIVATAPVVAPKALDITKSFYGSLLPKNPGLLAYFNPSHNVPISINQPEALAASIVAYASNITDLSPILTPGGPVDAINHRHCALAVEPGHYVTVHDNLMVAIGDVLGGAVTPPVASAWSEAVLFLAKACIEAEESIYKMAEKRAGGWSGFTNFQVTEIKDVAKDIKSFSFKPASAVPLNGGGFEFDAGQYLSVKVDPKGDGLTAPRHYTATSPPGADFLQCTTKREAKGKVSNYMHDELKVGDEVKLAAPFGVFTLAHGGNGSAVLMSAGIGVTPMVNFSRTLGDKVKLAVHVDKTADHHAWKSHFSDLPSLDKYTLTGGRASPAALAEETLAKVGTDHTFYMCGPAKWMEEVQKELSSRGARQVMTEVFGSQLATGCPFSASASK